MKIGQILKEKRASLSFEFFPPKDEAGTDRLFHHIPELEKLKPDFVSVTYGAGGGTRKNTYRVVKRILRETGLLPMPHLTCINQSDDELKDIMEEYRQLGVENLLALRGDPPEVDGKPVIPEDEHCHANYLVSLARSVYNFSIGVAAYPEGHIESPDMETDMKYTKLKVDAGADFIITQMFYDNRYYYDFLERSIKAGIRVPVIPGIMPISDTERVKRFCVKCGTTIPEPVLQRLEKAGPEIKKVGIEIATEQCADLLAHGVRYFHFYTLNHSDTVSQIVTGLGLQDIVKQAGERVS